MPKKKSVKAPASKLELSEMLGAINRDRSKRHADSIGLKPLPKPAKKVKLPPDPEGMNEERASWALHAVKAFQEATGSDDDTAIGDLLADLRHLCDRMGAQFGESLDAMVASSARCYAAETLRPGARERKLTKPVCENCGSDDVTQDGLLRFDTDTQQWEMSAELDNADCESCGGETNLERRPLDFDPFDHGYKITRVEIAEQPDGGHKVRLYRPGETRKPQKLTDTAISGVAARALALVIAGDAADLSIIETMERA